MTKYNWKSNLSEEILKSKSLLYKIEDKSIPIIYLKLIFENGALTETKDNRGVTSLLSQMLLNGNKKFPQNEINLELDSMGASLSIASGYDYFAIISRIPSENFINFINFLDKVLFGKIEFDEEKLNISKNKAKNLLLMIKDNESYLSSMIFSNIIFKNRNYGLLSSGNSKSLDKLKISNLVERLEYIKKSKHFSLIGGDYSDTDILKLKEFTNKFSMKESISNKKMELHTPKGFELYYYQKSDKNKVNVIIGAPSIPLTDKKIHSLLIFNKYFGSDFTSILPQEIREKNGWSYYANSEFSLYKYATLFSMEYAPNIENLLVSFKYLKELFIKNINNKPEKEHLDFTKSKIMNSYDFKFSTTVKKLSLLSDLKLYNYPNDFFKDYTLNVSEINNEILGENIRELINPNNQIVIMVGNVEKELESLKNSKLFSKIEKLENLDYLD